MNYEHTRTSAYEQQWLHFPIENDLSFVPKSRILDDISQKYEDGILNGTSFEIINNRVEKQRVKFLKLLDSWENNETQFEDYIKPSNSSFRIAKTVLRNLKSNDFNFLDEFSVTPYGTIEIIFENDSFKLYIELGGENSKYFVSNEDNIELSLKFNNAAFSKIQTGLLDIIQNLDK